jgi:hypothetical protein
VDISTPTLPRRLAIFELSGFCSGIQISEGRAFVAAYYVGLHIVDIRDPKKPLPIDHFQQGVYWDAAARDNIAYYQSVDLARDFAYGVLLRGFGAAHKGEQGELSGVSFCSQETGAIFPPMRRKLTFTLSSFGRRQPRDHPTSNDSREEVRTTGCPIGIVSTHSFHSRRHRDDRSKRDSRNMISLLLIT